MRTSQGDAPGLNKGRGEVGAGDVTKAKEKIFKTEAMVDVSESSNKVTSKKRSLILMRKWPIIILERMK